MTAEEFCVFRVPFVEMFLTFKTFFTLFSARAHQRPKILSKMSKNSRQSMRKRQIQGSHSLQIITNLKMHR